MPGVGLISVIMAFPLDGDLDISWSAWALSEINNRVHKRCFEKKKFKKVHK